MRHVLRIGMSLRTRLTLWYGALLAVTLAAVSVFVYFTLQQQLSTSMDDRLVVRADAIGREVGTSIGSLGLQPEDVPPGVLASKLGEFVEPGIYVQLLNPKGAILAAPPNLVGGELPVPSSARQAIIENRRIYETIAVPAGDAGDAKVRLLTQPLHQSGSGDVVGAVQVAESFTPFESTMSAVERLLVSATIGASLLAVVVGWLLTRAALRPVARITETARHIAATGDYRRRLHVDAPRFGHGDELFFLAATFNDMIARLESLLDSQRRLLADTSHELRNPITIIRGNLALLRRDSVPEATRREAVLEADEESARMGRLVADLLLLARADAGELPPLQRHLVDLAELASDVLERARPSAGDRRLSLVSEGSSAVLGDPDRLRQLISNLVENAIRYTPRTGRIDVRIAGRKDVHISDRKVQQPGRPVRSRSARAPGRTSYEMAVLSIADSGIGIAATDLPHVFDRFFRADKARSRAHGGTGLGLSIAQYIAIAHGGSIEAASEGPNRGAIFTLRLPLAPVPAPPPSRPPTSRTPAAAAR